MRRRAYAIWHVLLGRPVIFGFIRANVDIASFGDTEGPVRIISDLCRFEFPDGTKVIDPCGKNFGVGLDGHKFALKPRQTYVVRRGV